jgi:hypothetical protein
MGTHHQEVGTGAIDWKAIAPYWSAFPGMRSLEVRAREDLDGAVSTSTLFAENLLAGE